MLPHPGGLELVFAERLERARDQAGVTVGAQAEIGLEQFACRGLARQPGIGALCEAGIDLGRFGRVVSVEEDDVEVRRVAKLLAAQLAVADDGESGEFPVADLDLAPAQGDGQLDHGVGQG